MIRATYHPAVQRDVDKILRHYDRIAPHLGDEFFAEFQAIAERAAALPERGESNLTQEIGIASPTNITGISFRTGYRNWPSSRISPESKGELTGFPERFFNVPASTC